MSSIQSSTNYPIARHTRRPELGLGGFVKPMHLAMAALALAAQGALAGGAIYVPSQPIPAPAPAPAPAPVTTIPAAAAKLPALPASVPVTDFSSGVFQSKGTINGWIAKDDRAKMKAHAWGLFAEAMRPMYNDNGSIVRLFDTWHSLDEAVPAIGDPLVGFGSGKALNRPKAKLQKLEAAGQLVHGQTQASLAAKRQAGLMRGNLSLADAAVSDVKYNPAIGRLIEGQLTIKGTSPTTGQPLVAGYNLSKQIQPGKFASVNFTDTKAVMLKPAFTIVKAKGPTVIARWEESMNVTNPKNVTSHTLPNNANRAVASERTWTKEAVVYPAFTTSWSNPTYYGRDGAPRAKPYNLSSLPKYSLNDFHFIKLNQSQVDAIKTGILMELMGPNLDNIEVGDYAVLTSFHIATREIDSWTWQTFWWQPLGGESLQQNGTPSALQSKFKSDPAYAPLKHFRAGVGYSYADSMGQAVIASNPYLEGSFGLPADLATVFGPTAATDGVNVFIRSSNDTPLTYNGTTYVHAPAFGLRTNCVTCHVGAAYPADSLGALPAGTQGIYPDWGTLKSSDALFSGRVRTHFLWGVTNKISDREAEALAAGKTLP